MTCLCDFATLRLSANCRFQVYPFRTACRSHFLFNLLDFKKLSDSNAPKSSFAARQNFVNHGCLNELPIARKKGDNAG